MENPQSGTSWCTAPRSSAHRSSAPVAKKRPRLKRSNVPKGGLLLAMFGTRRRRRQEASDFRREHDMSSVFRYHIQAGAPLCSRRATSFELPWVAVHGIDSICAVARSNDMRRLLHDMMPHAEMDPELFPGHNWNIRFWNTIISEVEDIAAPSGESRRRFKKSSKKPFGVGPSGKSRQILGKKRFGVVSVFKDTNEVRKVRSRQVYSANQITVTIHQLASSDEYDVEKAIEFLQEELESGAVFTFDRTTQTAISAFQHLFQQEFEADEIRAFVLKKNEPMGRELKQIRENPDIEECLAIINGA